MKNFFQYLIIVLGLILLLSYGLAVANAQVSLPQPDKSVFIPLLYNGAPPRYAISGRVLDTQGVPVSGVNIRTDQGQLAVTDLNGNYKIENLPAGTYVVTPSQEGTVFSPTSAVVVVPPNVSNINFSAEVTYYEGLLNGGFEDNTAWDVPLTAYPAGYTTSQAHGGSRSMRTGIAKTADNTYSYSSAQQKVSIPAGTSSASLTLWAKPYSVKAAGLSLPPAPAAGTPLGDVQMSGDVQYVLVLDNNLNIINTLLWTLSDSQTWTKYQFNLTAYAGRTIWIHFGTYNDGLAGIASMYVDDASLAISPTPAPCQELIVNGDFSKDNGWTILDTAYHAGYSSAEYYSPFRSMRTGIVNPADNVYSYSDFRQQVSIPTGDHHTSLGMWVYPVSGESPLGYLPMPERTQLFSEVQLDYDTQYLLVLDKDKNWIDTLVWMRSNSKAWTYMQFDLSAYAGKTIYLQWGSYNNGGGGVTSMYVDDVSLYACP